MPVPLLVVSTALFLSGAAGLVYQVVWLRMLGLVFGHAVDALTAVLVAFMSGLALGSALGGRLSSRARAPLAIYAWLETGIAVYALCLPPGLPGLTRVSLTLRDAFGLSYEGWSLVQVALAFLVLLPPTVLMGATLPLVSQALASGGEAPGRRVGALYAVNTWGAVTGTLAAGYFLLPPWATGSPSGSPPAPTWPPRPSPSPSRAGVGRSPLSLSSPAPERRVPLEWRG